VDNQQLGNFFQRDMENIVNAKARKLQAAFTAQMQALIATQQKTAQNFTTAPSADDKGQQPRLKKPKALRSEKSDVIVQIIVATADRVITRGSQMLVLIQAIMRVRSKKKEG
jgi:hypothetical protein